MRQFLRPLAGVAFVVAAAFGTAPVQAREVVAFHDNVPAGTIVVKTHERRLYLVMGDGRALRYPVGVGMGSKQWSGTTRIDGKYVAPAWSPPKEVKRDKPSLPDVIAGGSPKNPMGAAAMTLAGGEYAIHGTNMPRSIGGFVSYGCIRMYNEDVLDLYSRVSVGTTVSVVREGFRRAGKGASRRARMVTRRARAARFARPTKSEIQKSLASPLCSQSP
jgi:lipoprotein-anchoring transpeptidase ErfK/SrfK